MKRLILLGALSFFTLTACKNDKSTPEYTSTYICQDHCKGSGSAEKGSCPICKKTYTFNPDAKPDIKVDANAPIRAQSKEDLEEMK